MLVLVHPPLHQELVTLDKIMKGQVANLDNCVYELGSMSKQQRRAFIGEIMLSDYTKRYESKLKGELDSYPLMLYVFEEADVIFGSYSMRTNDQYSPVFQQYVSVGRNYGMRGFLISTAEQGEVAPSLRRRTRKIYGRVISKADISSTKKQGVLVDLTKTEQYHFTYQHHTQRIPDTCNNTPTDYQVQSPIHTQQQTQFNDRWWVTFLGTLGAFLLFWSQLMAL